MANRERKKIIEDIKEEIKDASQIVETKLQKVSWNAKMLAKTGALLDVVLNKLISRKLLTFALASTFLGLGTLESGDWTLVACIYIGVQGAIDFFRIKHGISD